MILQGWAHGFRSRTACCAHLAVGSGFASAAKAANGAADLDFALPGDSLEVLRKKNKNLRARLHETPWPRVTSFRANGQLYRLPWRPDHGYCSPSVSDSHLRYLSGFFDGDGCVVYSSSAGCCQLNIAQSFDAADVLMLYCRAFGGGIYHKSDGAGLRKPVLQWNLTRRKMACQAASLLSHHSITKKEQLHIAAHAYKTRAGRAVAVEELKTLKKFDSSIGDENSCSWEYLAGFFDADGCISQLGKNSLRLQLAQKHRTVLEYVQKFLASEMGVETTIFSSPSIYQIQIGATATCQLIVEKMLKAGLTRKRRQAELVLDFKPENAEAIRQALKTLNGNQIYGRSLDEAGLDRAKDIKNARGRAGHAAKHGRYSEAANLRKQVEVMKLDHEIGKAQHENYDLREYICKIHGLWYNKAR